MSRLDDFTLEEVSIRLVTDRTHLHEKPISSPIDAVEFLKEKMTEFDREVLCVVNLKSDGKPINFTFVSVGALNETIAHPREILKSAILSNANSILLMHNHPSGNVTPSKEDVKLTDRMLTVCSYVGISLIDHIIVGPETDGFFSMNEKKLLNKPTVMLNTDVNQLDFNKSLVAEPKQTILSNTKMKM